MEWGYLVMENVDHYGCLTKKNCQLKLSTMARSFFNIPRVGDVNFCYKSMFCKEMLTSISKLSNSLKDSEFICGFLTF